MSFWQSLNARERLVVKSGGLLVALSVFYLYLWQPSMAKLQQLRLEVPQQRATLAWMQHATAQARPFLASPEAGAEQTPMLTLIERAAIQSGVQQSIQRVQPSDNGQVKLWFESVLADNWFDMLEQLARQGVGVESANLVRAAPGLITARVTLAR